MRANKATTAPDVDGELGYSRVGMVIPNQTYGNRLRPALTGTQAQYEEQRYRVSHKRYRGHLTFSDYKVG